MVLLILESLGSTELLFILAMALIFFGPRKLPQLSRTFGKSMAEFRRASEDFKRTWDREVTLEEATAFINEPVTTQASATATTSSGEALQPPTIEAVAADRIIARQSGMSADSNPSVAEAVDHSTPSRKSDWL